MTALAQAPSGTRSLVVECEMPHSPQKIWRANRRHLDADAMIDLASDCWLCWDDR